MPQRYKTVPPLKPSKLPAPIMFVGEAPSDEEMIQGEPLVGPAGRVFASILRTAGLDRSNYYITNVYNTQPEGNDISLYRSDKDRTDEALQRLTAEVEEANANVIVPLGATALWAFNGQNAITPYRGSVTPATRINPGAKMVPTYHPSHVLQQWKYFPVVTADIIKAAAEAAKGPRIVYPSVALTIRPSIEDLIKWKPKLLNPDRMLSVDIETGWGQITCIGFAPNAKEAICVPFWDFGRPNHSYWKTPDEEYTAMRIIEEILASDAPKLFQNGPYDVNWLWRKWHMPVMNYRFDTRLAHQSLYPELPKDLAFLGASYTDLGAWKNWGGRYTSGNKGEELK